MSPRFAIPLALSQCVLCYPPGLSCCTLLARAKYNQFCICVGVGGRQPAMERVGVWQRQRYQEQR